MSIGREDAPRHGRDRRRRSRRPARFLAARSFRFRFHQGGRERAPARRIAVARARQQCGHGGRSRSHAVRIRAALRREPHGPLPADAASPVAPARKRARPRGDGGQRRPPARRWYRFRSGAAPHGVAYRCRRVPPIQAGQRPFSAELARRVDRSRITTYSLHPGVVASDIWRHVPWPARAVMKLFMLSPEQGAQTTLHCATSPEAARETGLYYDASRVKHPSSVAADAALARRLREWSVEETEKS